MNAPFNKQADTRSEVRRMFDRIAKRYDLLNHLLSFGQDYYWRGAVARHLQGRTVYRLADLATGTGDQLLSLFYRVPSIRSAVGIDVSWNMLKIGQQKLVDRGADQVIKMVHGDALNIPLQDNSVTAVTITFGIRNVTNVELGLREMARVLEPGGSVIILEFSLPKNPVFRTFYLFYFRHILPIIGGFISGDNTAYTYLNRTVESFPYGDAFCALMTEAGFSEVRARPLTFGIATIYYGEKP